MVVAVTGANRCRKGLDLREWLLVMSFLPALRVCVWGRKWVGTKIRIGIPMWCDGKRWQVSWAAVTVLTAHCSLTPGTPTSTSPRAPIHVEMPQAPELGVPLTAVPPH